MNLRLVTTGLVPLTIGSDEVFQLQGILDQLPWDLTAGTVDLVLSDPTGALTTISATITGRGAQAAWTVAAPAGRWLRTWHIQDASGLTQVAQAIPFDVVAA